MQNDAFKDTVHRYLFQNNCADKNAYSAYVEKFFFFFKKSCSHEHGKILSSSADLLTVELCLLPSVAKLCIENICPVSLER